MPELRCAGRPVDDHLQPTGPPCGRRLRDRPGDLHQRAIAAGWSIAEDGTATCDRCRRPPREAIELAREVHSA